MGGRSKRVRNSPKQGELQVPGFPDPVAKQRLDLPADVALAVSDAEGEVRALNSSTSTRNLEAVAQLLLRAESVASSRIEGLELSQRNLARALFDASTARGTAKFVAGSPRRGSSAARLIEMLPAYPIIGVRAAAEALNVSDEAARLALKALDATGVVRKVTTGRYKARVGGRGVV